MVAFWDSEKPQQKTVEGNRLGIQPKNEERQQKTNWKYDSSKILNRSRQRIY